MMLLLERLLLFSKDLRFVKIFACSNNCLAKDILVAVLANKDIPAQNGHDVLLSIAKKIRSLTHWHDFKSDRGGS
jgi:hypothetical protein